MTKSYKGLSRSLLIGPSALALAGFMAATPALAANEAPAGSAAPASADAAGAIDTIIVTALKRPENVQDVPTSITAFSGVQIEKAHITSLDDLARMVPSLSILEANNNRNSSLIIRNIGSSGTNPGIEPSVGLFLDGVYIPAAGAAFTTLLDTSTVEVLRGPQGTLYGRNTPVGAINITSRAPTSTPDAMIDVQYGNYDRTRIAGYFGGGISDTLSGRASLWLDDRSGYEKNLYNGSDVNDSNQFGGRGRLRWVPDRATTVDFIAYYSNIETNGTIGAQINPYGPGGIATAGFLTASAAAAPGHPFVALGKFQVNDDKTPSDKTQTYGASTQVNRDLPFGATITDILAYNYFDDNLPSVSTDGLPQDVNQWNQDETLKSTSNELRIASTGKNRVDYVGGVYLFHEDLFYGSNLLIDAGANRFFGPAGYFSVGDYSAFTFRQKTDSYAFFGQSTLHVTDRFRLTGGLRYSDDKKTASMFNVNSNAVTGKVSTPFNALLMPPMSQPNLARSDHSTTWTAGAQYDLADHVMLYVTAGSGFKDGGFNARASGTPPFDFGPEKSLTYELGMKSTFFGKRLLVNADVYRMTLDGFQTSTLNNVTGSGFIVGNAGNVRVQGVEMDVQAHPVSHLSLNGNVSYADTVYTSYAAGPCITTYTPTAPNPPPGTPQPNTTPAGTCNYTGFTPSSSPKWRGSVGGRWEQPWLNTGYNWYVASSVSYVSSQYEDASLDPRSFQKAITLLDASAGFESASGKWKISIWGRNLTNQAYYVAEVAQPLGAAISAGGAAGANGFFGWYGTPRTFGIEASYKY